MRQEVAAQDADQRFQIDVSIPCLAPALLEVLPVGLGFGEGLTVAAHVAHPRLRTTPVAVHTLWVFPAGHLHGLRSVGKAHRAPTPAGHGAEDDASTADEVGRTGEDLKGGDPAGHRAFEPGVVGPHGRFCPHTRRGGAYHFVAVAVGSQAGRWVHAQVGVGVDQSRRDPGIAHVEHLAGCARRPLTRGTNPADPTVFDPHAAGREPVASTRHHHGRTDLQVAFVWRDRVRFDRLSGRALDVLPRVQAVLSFRGTGHESCRDENSHPASLHPSSSWGARPPS